MQSKKQSDIHRIEKLRRNKRRRKKSAQETRLQGIVDEANIGTQARGGCPEIALERWNI